MGLDIRLDYCHSMATCDDQDPPERKRNMFFMETQRGKEVPVVNDYIFVCKDKDRRRFQCRTRGCLSSINVSEDENGPYYIGSPLHDHPPHSEIIAKMKRRNELRVQARSKENRRLSTRQIAVEFRHDHAPTRRAAQAVTASPSAHYAARSSIRKPLSHIKRPSIPRRKRPCSRRTRVQTIAVMPAASCHHIPVHKSLPHNQAPQSIPRHTRPQLIQTRLAPRPYSLTTIRR